MGDLAQISLHRRWTPERLGISAYGRLYKPGSGLDEDQVRAAEVEQVYNDAMKSNGGPIDVSALAQYFGLNEPDKDELDADDEAKDLNKEMKEQRDVLKKILLARASVGFF